MMKNTFQVKIEEDSGIKYVCRKEDELTKNNRQKQREFISAAMPQMENPRYCPVKSYEKYISMLSNEVPYLWQTARFITFHPEKGHQYGPGKIGHNKLGEFVKKIREKCEISADYTNHSLRATGITILKRELFGQTGHVNQWPSLKE